MCVLGNDVGWSDQTLFTRGIFMTPDWKATRLSIFFCAGVLLELGGCGDGIDPGGADGGCSITNKEDGTVTITCDDGTAFDLLVDYWLPKHSMPTARGGLASSVVDGNIYAIGGTNGDTVLNTIETYDPASDSWASKTPMPTARNGLTSSVVNGNIYAIGGGSSSFAGCDDALSTTVEAYDPATDSWATKTPMPTARSGLTSSVVDGKIYAIGGCSNGSGGEVYGNTVEVYDPATDSWTTQTPMPTARAFLTSSVVGGKIYTIGGWNGDSSNWNLNTVEVYDPVTNMWTAQTPMPTPRLFLTSSVVDGEIYAVGGGVQAGGGLAALNTVEAYDPVTNTWTTKAALPTARAFPTSSVVDGELYVTGGFIGAGVFLPAGTVEMLP
jgi:N-acetylneuraminic acid mutarotase